LAEPGEKMAAVSMRYRHLAHAAREGATSGALARSGK